jgi:hypothetical protein
MIQSLPKTPTYKHQIEHRVFCMSHLVGGFHVQIQHRVMLVNLLSILCLSFLICKTGRMIVPTSRSCED